MYPGGVEGVPVFLVEGDGIGVVEGREELGWLDAVELEPGEVDADFVAAVGGGEEEWGFLSGRSVCSDVMSTRRRPTFAV